MFMGPLDPIGVYMTKRQLLVLEAIESHWEQYSCGPTLQGIAEAIGVSSKSTVHAMIKRLEDGGWVTMQPNRWRTVMSTRNSPFKNINKTVDEQVKI